MRIMLRARTVSTSDVAFCAKNCKAARNWELDCAFGIEADRGWNSSRDCFSAVLSHPFDSAIIWECCKRLSGYEERRG
jgi:hypothetical protein